MSLAAQVTARVQAAGRVQSGLTKSLTDSTIEFSFNVSDCTTVWSDRRTFPSLGYEDIDLAGVGLGVVKLLCLKNLSATSSIALAAGWNGSQFSIFRQDVTAWNFSPMINLGSLTLRGYPIRERGAMLLSCPGSAGFSTAVGGSILRVGGVPGESYEIYVMGT